MLSTKSAAPDRLRQTQVVLALLGLIDAAYLTFLKLNGAYASCIGAGNCELVNQSRFSELWGLPIALFGGLTYLLLLGLILAEPRFEPLREWGPMAVFAISTFGVLYSGYLTYIEFAVLRAYCPYCLLSAIAMLAIWIVAIVRLRQLLGAGAE